MDTTYWVIQNNSNNSGFEVTLTEAYFWASLDDYTVIGRESCQHLIV